MNKFKVGDLVIGNKENIYNITSEGTICKVVESEF